MTIRAFSLQQSKKRTEKQQQLYENTTKTLRTSTKTGASLQILYAYATYMQKDLTLALLPSYLCSAKGEQTGPNSPPVAQDS